MQRIVFCATKRVWNQSDYDELILDQMDQIKQRVHLKFTWSPYEVHIMNCKVWTPKFQTKNLISCNPPDLQVSFSSLDELRAIWCERKTEGKYLLRTRCITLLDPNYSFAAVCSFCKFLQSVLCALFQFLCLSSVSSVLRMSHWQMVNFGKTHQLLLWQYSAKVQTFRVTICDLRSDDWSSLASNRFSIA